MYEYRCPECKKTVVRSAAFNRLVCEHCGHEWTPGVSAPIVVQPYAPVIPVYPDTPGIPGSYPYYPYYPPYPIYHPYDRPAEPIWKYETICGSSGSSEYVKWS